MDGHRTSFKAHTNPLTNPMGQLSTALTQKPGFGLVQQQGQGSGVRDSVHSYAIDTPKANIH